MKRNWSARTAARAAMPALFLLAGCATAIPPVEVTRFHPGGVPQSGSVSIVPAAPGADAQSLEFRTSANALSAALGRVGFTVLDEGEGGADYKALLSISSDRFDPAVKKSPVKVGVGGSTGSYGSSLGVGIGIDLSGPPKPIITSRMRVQIRRASDDVALWEGRAATQAKEGTPAAQPGIAAGKLANALFKDFPGKSGVTITVK